MSVTKRDSWALDSAHRLRQHLMRAVLLGKNFAPDQTYELSKAGQVGPKSAAIAAIFQHWADIWASDNRDAEQLRARGADGLAVEIDADSSWASCMAEAELEVGRFLAGHKLTTGAAA